MSRTLALLLATIALLSAPAVASADVRLTLDVMRLSLQSRGDEPIARRMLQVPDGARPGERPLFQPIQVQAALWRVQVAQLTLAQALSLGLQQSTQRDDAIASSVPAGAFDRGPTVVRTRMLRLPRIRF